MQSWGGGCAGGVVVWLEKRQAGVPQTPSGVLTRVRTSGALSTPVVSAWPMGAAEGQPDTSLLAPMWVNSHWKRKQKFPGANREKVSPLLLQVFILEA